MSNKFRDNTAPSRFADYRSGRPDTKKMREKLESEVEQFLSQGGEIESIETGKTGYKVHARSFIINHEIDKRVKK